MTNISEFETTSNSISLAKVDGKSFTIVSVEKSDYEEGSGDERVSTAGVKITVAEDFDGINILHTTRTAVVSKLTSEAVLEALKSGSIGPVKCVKAKSGNGKDYFKLVDA
mgnify:FL=1|jgi:hypothetical protein|tara:strand:+ start:169 stop:498 length:330 start_codon:yes stop_codon:yes gene_type:complete